MGFREQHPGAQWHLPARERQELPLPGCPLCPQKHGESEPRGGALLGCCAGEGEVSPQSSGEDTTQQGPSFQFLEPAGCLSKRMSGRTNYLYAIFTNPFPWEFPPEIMKTSVTDLKRNLSASANRGRPIVPLRQALGGRLSAFCQLHLRPPPPRGGEGGTLRTSAVGSPALLRIHTQL